MEFPIARGVAAAALLGAVLSAGRPQASPAALYGVEYLDSLGGSRSAGNSINHDGLIAGYSNLTGNMYRHATLWQGTSLVDLGTLGAPTVAKNSAVFWPNKNTSGLIVGISQTDSPDPWGEAWSCSAFFPVATGTGRRCLGFVWENGVMRPLPTLGGTHGYAAAANNHRQIVGWAENTVRDGTCTPPQMFQFRAVVWGPHGDQIRVLPILPGDTSSAATAINDKGQIVGISGTCDEAVGGATAAHSVIWEEAGVTEIPNLGGSEGNTPTAINENGDVAGFSNRPGNLVTEAFFWTNAGGLKALGFLEGHGFSQAFGINNHAQVVGISCTGDFSECRAFLWQDDVMTDLNSLVSLNPGELLTTANDINDDSAIVGRALKAGQRPAYVATPAAGSDSTAALRSNTGAGRGRRTATVSLPAGFVREIVSPLGPRRANPDRRVHQ